jgi:phosphate-selective porin OprO/OprP
VDGAEEMPFRTGACFLIATSLLANSAEAQEPPLSQRHKPYAQTVSPAERDVALGAGINSELHEGVGSDFNPDASQATPPAVIDPLEERFSAIEKRLNDADKAKSKLPQVTVSGVFQADGVVFNQNQLNRDVYGLIENGADFRRARLGAKAAVAENMNAFMQMDFAFFGRPTFTDLWVETTDIPILGNVRAGQWKQPFGLEVVSSFRYTTMMERSSTFQAFTPFRHIGIGFYDHTEDLKTTWAMSFFRTGQDQFGNSLSTNGGNGLSGRLTHLLWYDDECGDNYLHVGGGYYLNSPPRDLVRFRSAPELFVGEFAPLPGTEGTSGQALPGIFLGTPFFVDTGILLDVDHVHTFGTEVLWVAGPLSLQAEGMAAMVDHAALPVDSLYGGYLTLGYFLTGEHRPYDRKAGAVDRVIPFEDFKRGGGYGAWELTARLSYIDLTEGAINGGDMENLTTGLNWYLNPYCKCVFNHVYSWTQAGARPNPALAGANTQAHIFGVRCQIDF